MRKFSIYRIFKVMNNNIQYHEIGSVYFKGLWQRFSWKQDKGDCSRLDTRNVKV